MKSEATAFAPATCGNVCVGYDILGLCYSDVGDTVTVKKTSTPIVIIDSIEGEDSLSLDASKNTAGIVLQELIDKEKLDFGFTLRIKKGISLGSGMGGSAASAIGALVAANSLLEKQLSKEKLLQYSLEGERLACGYGHADNVAPCLYGGLTLLSNGEIIQLPFPEDISILLVHPHLTVKTSDARDILKPQYLLKDYVSQTQNLAGFISSCYQKDRLLMRKSFSDVLVEPLRSSLTFGFSKCREMANSMGVIGYALSGSGPSQIALCENKDQAKELKEKITQFYMNENIQIDSFIGPINMKGAVVL